MEKKFNYQHLFDQALARIKAIRAPRSERQEIKDLEWNEVRNQAVFDFGGETFEKSSLVYSGAKNVSISCLAFIIGQLLDKHWSVEPVKVPKAQGLLEKVRFAYKDCSHNTLLLFKDIEDSSFWKKSDMEPQEVQELIDANQCDSCKYIYFMLDNAYLQLISRNDDESDPGRGSNIYSLKWFFEEYFGEDEYIRFETALKKYIDEVNTHIGYVIIKPLVPSALNNFKRNVECTLVNYHYDSIKDLEYGKHRIYEKDYEEIKEQFLEDKMLLTMLGERDFAESLITAEWLLDSMKKAKVIDLTVIGMGYFKAVEQLVFDLICLHKNEGLEIQKARSRKDLPSKVPLEDKYISEDAIDTTLGSMANFIKENLYTLFRKDVTWASKEFVREAVFSYAKLRNGFFHKDNIHSMDTINEIRDTSFYMFFLLLGIFNMQESYLVELGYPEENTADYARLCEYIDYHNGDLFFVDLGEKEERLLFAHYDMNMKSNDNSQVQHSGVYFKELGQGGGIIRFLEENLPKCIYLGKFEFEHAERVSIEPVKVRKVFENGEFVGPTRVEDNMIDY